jgi:Outer membrane protein beta-barrel domain
MRNILGMGFLCLLLPALTQAQLPGGSIFVGYSYVNSDIPFNNPIQFFPNGRTSLNGWNGSLEVKLLPWIQGVADFGGHYGTQSITLTCEVIQNCGFTRVNANANLHTYMFGPQAAITIGKITPYAHALFGWAHTSAHTSGLSAMDSAFSTAIGGGLDYRLIRGLGWRVQGDYLQTRFFNGTQANFRFSTGLALHF